MTVIFILVSTFSIYILFRSVGKGINFSDIHIFNRQIVQFLIGLLLIFFTMDSLRSYFVFKTLNIHIKYSYIIKLMFINVFVSNITPFYAGGAFATIFLLNKKGITLGKAAAATMIRSILSSTFFLVVVPIAFIVVNGQLNTQSNHLGIYLFVAISINALLLYLLFRLAKNNKIIKKIIFGLLKWIMKKKKLSYKKFHIICYNSFKQIDLFSENFISFFKGKIVFILMSFIVTVGYFITLFMFSVVLIKSLGYDHSTLFIIGKQIIVNFIMYFGFTPGASGIAEGGYTLIYRSMVNEYELLSITFYWRLFTVFIASVIGFFIFYFEMAKHFKHK